METPKGYERLVLPGRTPPLKDEDLLTGRARAGGFHARPGRPSAVDPGSDGSAWLGERRARGAWTGPTPRGARAAGRTYPGGGALSGAGRRPSDVQVTQVEARPHVDRAPGVVRLDHQFELADDVLEDLELDDDFRDHGCTGQSVTGRSRCSTGRGAAARRRRPRYARTHRSSGWRTPRGCTPPHGSGGASSPSRRRRARRFPRGTRQG